MKTGEFADLFEQNGPVLDHFAGVYAYDMCPTTLDVNKFIVVNTE